MTKDRYSAGAVKGYVEAPRAVNAFLSGSTGSTPVRPTNPLRLLRLL